MRCPGLSTWQRSRSHRRRGRRSLGIDCRLENIRLASITPRIRRRTIPTHNAASFRCLSPNHRSRLNGFAAASQDSDPQFHEVCVEAKSRTAGGRCTLQQEVIRFPKPVRACHAPFGVSAPRVACVPVWDVAKPILLQPKRSSNIRQKRFDDSGMYRQSNSFSMRPSTYLIVSELPSGANRNSVGPVTIVS